MNVPPEHLGQHNPYHPHHLDTAVTEEPQTLIGSGNGNPQEAATSEQSFPEENPISVDTNPDAATTDSPEG